MKKLPIFAAIALTFATLTAFAHEYTLGDLEIIHPHMLPTPPSAPVAGGYLVIRNNGREADRLIGGSAAFAGKLELHQMSMENDVMKMRKLPDGVEIPAGGEVELKRGGYHIMFMQLNTAVETGDKHKAMLEFEKAGAIEVEFSVDEMAPAGESKGEGAMDHSDHDAGKTDETASEAAQ